MGEASRTGPFLSSLLVHVMVVSGVFAENYLRPPLELDVPVPEQLLADDRYELNWYVSPDDLPPVEPLEPARTPEPKQPGDGSRPRFRLPQRVVADGPNAASNRQMVWDEAPQVELTRDVPSANFVEPSLPEVQVPRFELAEGQLLAPGRQALAAATAPRVQAQAATVPAPFQRDPRLRYWTPDSDNAPPDRQALGAEAAPAISNAPSEGLDIGQFQKLTRLRYWMPQEGVEEPGRQALSPGDAPRVATSPAQGINLEEFQRLSRLRYQQAESAPAPSAPERTALAGGEAAPRIGTPASGSSAGEAAEIAQAQALAALGAVQKPARAVVGVDPEPNAVAPRGSRSGSFSAGPDAEPNSGGAGSGGSNEGDSGEVASLRIPHLTVSPANSTGAKGASDGTAPRPGGLDTPPGTDHDRLLRLLRGEQASSRPAIGVLAPEKAVDPETPFRGRSVYRLAINMPNISSYAGSWVIEFAQAKEDEATPGDLNPPSPRLKVDPVYSRAAIDEKIEGDVVLHAIIRSDGLVDSIQVIKELDERLDESAKTALSKWRFDPATKNGVPIDVETVVRIPFRLAPPPDSKR